MLEQVAQLERLSRLRRFLSPQVADLIIASGDDSFLESHRREITVVFCDLRGSTAFADSVEPEELMAMLREYHAILGEEVHRYAGTVEHFAGDGLMVFFNDPLPCADHPARAVQRAVATRARFHELSARWHRLGHELELGVGGATGYATLGRIGSEGRYDYGAVGRVTILAQRLSDAARGGQSLNSPSVLARIEPLVEVEPVGALELKGYRRPVEAVNVVALRDSRKTAAPATPAGVKPHPKRR